VFQKNIKIASFFKHPTIELTKVHILVEKEALEIIHHPRASEP